MDEYIKRKYAVDAVVDVYYDTLDINLSCEKFEAAIIEIPAADVAPMVHGRWLDRPKNQGLKDEEIGTVGMVDGEPRSSCYCSECGEWLVASDEYAVKGNYCPNCGAKMDGGEY